MRKFCEKCGSPVDAEDKCPKCDKPGPTAPSFTSPTPELTKGVASAKEVLSTDAQKGGTSVKKVLRRILIGIIVLLSVYTVTIITVGFLVYFNVFNIPEINDVFVYLGIKEEVLYEAPSQPADENDPADPAPQPDPDDNGGDDDLSIPYEVTPPDADEYFSDNSTVIATIDALDSEDVHTESDAYDNFDERGLAMYPITTEYSMDGVYSEAARISSYSSRQHPMYQTYYITSNDDVWLIFEINGVMLASPLSYNEQLASGAPVMISETDTITSYDSTKNKFYVNTPHSSVINLKTVARIDAETLEALTKGAIDNL